MLTEHNFSIGNADNLVYFDEFYQKLKERFDRYTKTNLFNYNPNDYIIN